MSARYVTLPEGHVSNCGVDVVLAWVTGVDHETISELHGLCSLTAQFTGHDHLTAAGVGLHDEAQHTVARPKGGTLHSLTHYEHDYYYK